jgi:polyferredoxin/formate hydrogenlyase subunit 6/NADH:ubiquinone oxidoreductase subunit I
MKIVTARRISQMFFLLLFLWFCFVTTLGEQGWQLRGWPVNWFLELDPLVGLSTLLTTGTLYKGLAWGVGTVVLTIFLGRFFCSWVCPFGSLHHGIGYLARRKQSILKRAEANRYHPAQAVKYWILIFLLAVAAGDLVKMVLISPRSLSIPFWIVAVGLLTILTYLAIHKKRISFGRAIVVALSLAGVWAIFARGYAGGLLPSASLQIGLLDPIPLLQRSINLILLPILDQSVAAISPARRWYDHGFLIGLIFVTALLLNFRVPRFYCRFVCPLGALFGVLGRFAIWRIGKTEADCIDCMICEADCEGACQPASEIRISECVLCMNCRDQCRHGLIAYQHTVSAAGETSTPDVSRRQFVISSVAGLATLPVLRLEGHLGSNWSPGLMRPPGALPEPDFLARCIKCGQCMRICPTNVIHPAPLAQGLEELWTPILNFRIGTSGCQLNCIACGNICPTAAIRPISLEERLGVKQFKAKGPIRTGTAYVDRGRCLPWAMNTPCIVCQENCPVSPKAIYTRDVYDPVRLTAKALVAEATDHQITLTAAALPVGRFATGDYFCRIAGQKPRRIIEQGSDGIAVSAEDPFNPTPVSGEPIEILIRLQQPFVDPGHCIGCGVCEHECPVKGKRAIRVSAENESRNPSHKLLLSV